MNFRRFREYPILGDPGAVSRVLKNGGERFHKPACVAGVEMGKGLEGRGKGRGIWERGYCDWATKSIFVPNLWRCFMISLYGGAYLQARLFPLRP